MATKICPCCGMENDSAEKNCQICNFEFPLSEMQRPADPVAASDTRPSVPKEREPRPASPPPVNYRNLYEKPERKNDSRMPKSDPVGKTLASEYSASSQKASSSNKHLKIKNKRNSRTILVVIGGVLIVALLVSIPIIIINARKHSQNETSAPDVTTSSAETPIPSAAQSTDTVLKSGYIVSGADGYALLYQSADTSSSAIARAYTGDAIDIYSMDGNWYYAKLGDLTGYIPAENVTFTNPAQQTAAPVTEKPTQATTKVTAVTIPKPTISASIEITTIGDGDTFTLVTSGSYAYYVCEYKAYMGNGEYEQGTLTSSESRLKLIAGSVFQYVTATVTPYNIENTAGTSVSCRGDIGSGAAAVQSNSVTACTKYGQINTHGGVVASFTTSYVVNNGTSSHVRDSLGNAWHVTAVNYCNSRGVNWYELYDSDDGDYYGWVDASYIDFY